MHVMNCIGTQRQHLPDGNPLHPQGSKPPIGAFKEVVVFATRPHTNHSRDRVFVDPSAELLRKNDVSDEEVRLSVQHSVVVIVSEWHRKRSLQRAGFTDCAQHDIPDGGHRV